MNPPTITPCLWFDHNAEEAVALYTAVFPGSRTLGVTRCGPGGPGPAGSVLTIDFELAGQRFTALNGGPHFRFNEAVSFVVRCEKQEEIDGYWSALTAGGGSPGRCCWLKDRFGLSWQVVPSALLAMLKDPARSGRVMQALMGMDKPDLAALRAAGA